MGGKEPSEEAEAPVALGAGQFLRTVRCLRLAAGVSMSTGALESAFWHGFGYFHVQSYGENLAQMKECSLAKLVPV